jgi:hypothetical protein
MKELELLLQKELQEALDKQGVFLRAFSHGEQAYILHAPITLPTLTNDREAIEKRFCTQLRIFIGLVLYKNMRSVEKGFLFLPRKPRIEADPYGRGLRWQMLLRYAKLASNTSSISKPELNQIFERLGFDAIDQNRVEGLIVMLLNRKSLDDLRLPKVAVVEAFNTAGFELEGRLKELLS